MITISTDFRGRHQKQALTFMLGRELGWDFSCNGKDVWRYEEGAIDNTRNQDGHHCSQEHNGQQVCYKNIVTGQVSVCEPVQFRGGILADSM